MSHAPARRPVVGVTLDSEVAGGYSKLPWYALRQNYCDVIAQAGGRWASGAPAYPTRRWSRRATM